MLGQDMSDFSNGSILVVGHHFDKNRNTAGTVSLVGHLLKGHCIGADTGPFFDGSLDIVFGHIFIFGRHNGLPQSGICLRITSTQSRCQGNFLDQFSKYLASFGINGALFSFDGTPF